jgi:iron complex outermembrane receptor protein
MLEGKTRVFRIVPLLLANLAIALLCLSGGAAAQTVPVSAVPDNEIVVTAQKRSERLQDVPLAVATLSGDQLSARQINDTRALTQAVPSLTFQQAPNPVASSFRIRGIGTSLFGLGTEPAVSLVVDGVVNARQAQNFADFGDIERIEVLRGPQGTLFGKNATAGVISIVTKAPSKEFEGQVSGTVADMGEYRASGTVSGPISDRLGVRLSTYYNNVGGNLDNTLTGHDANGDRSWGVRGKIAWRPTDALKILLSADYTKSDANCCQPVLVKANNPLRASVSGPVTIEPDNHQVWNNDLTYANNNQQTYSITADWDLGPATLTLISAYQIYHLVQNQEVDNMGYNAPIYISPYASAQFDLNYGKTGLRNFSQELRVGSNGRDTPVTYVLGAYYSNLSIDRYFARRRAICSTGIFGQLCPAPSYQSLASFSKLSNESIAGFGQVEVKIVGGLSAIAGARIQRETLSVYGQTYGPIVASDTNFGGTPTAWAGESFGNTGFSGKAGLQYKFGRNLQSYATYTRGYKGLGLYTEIGADFAHQAPVRPEHVDAWELGLKGQSAGGALSFATALFLSNYSNLQVQANRSDPTTGVIAFVPTNAGSSQTKGFEFEATLRPSRNLSVTASVTYAKTRFDIDGLDCPPQFTLTAPTVALGGTRPINTCFRYQYRSAAGAVVTSGPVQDIRGGTLPASPKWRINLSPRYEHGLGGDLLGFAQVDLTFQSDEQFALEQDPLQRQGAFALVDLSFGVRHPDKGWSATVFVKNLLDKNYYTGMSPTALDPLNPALLDIYAFRPKNADRYLGGTVGLRW